MEKIWLKSYPNGVPAEIDTNPYPSLVTILDESCKNYKNDPAFYNFGVTLTYADLDKYACYFAAYLQKGLGLQKGDRIALMMPNILQYPIALLASLRIGLIVVNVNPLYTVPELVHQLKDSGAQTIIVLDHFAHTVAKAKEEVITLKHCIVTQYGDMFPFLKGLLVQFYLKHIKKKIPTFPPSFLNFKKCLALGKNLKWDIVALSPEDIAFLQYTGGTTGVSKGAILTHRNLVANCLQAEAWFKPILKEKKEIIVTALPLYHIFSLTANCLFVSKLGGLNVLITNPRDINHMVKEIKKFKFTVITGVNTLFNALLKNAEFARIDFSALKLSLGGGMAVQGIVAQKWQEITGVPLLEAYGLTETSPCVTINPPLLKTYNGSVGLPVSSTDIALLDNKGAQVSFQEVGELAVKGPQVMRGYWNNLAETEKVFTKDHWLLTGDMATIDERGFVRIVERKKDMILVSGFNVYPNEIEDVLMHMPGIREAAVIGIQNGESGEAVKAFLVREDEQITEKEVIEYCRKNLTGYKIPKQIEFRLELPKSNVGKILRRALK